MLPCSTAGRVSRPLKIVLRFVKNHQQKADRIAVIVAHDWQHWLVGAIRIFLHPEVRAYDKSHESEALKWIIG